MEYELVHEIKNSCPNNQMRDVFIEEVDTEDPLSLVRELLGGEPDELPVEQRRDGVTVFALRDGLRHVFTFTV